MRLRAVVHSDLLGRSARIVAALNSKPCTCAGSKRLTQHPLPDGGDLRMRLRDGNSGGEWRTW